MKNSRLRPKRTIALLAAASVLIGISGCSVNMSGGNTSASGGSNSLLLAADNGSPTFTRNFNPFSSSARTGVHYMYEPLEVVNTIDGKATPFLATQEQLISPTTIAYTIREGVKWSDGQPFTASDVVFTFNLIKKYPELDSLGQWQNIDSVESSGNTVTFHLKVPNVPAAEIIDQQIIVPEHIWKKVASPTTWTNPDPVVTGPYTLGQFTPNQYTLNKNTEYWQANKVAADKLILPAANSQLAIVKNRYDWAYAFIEDVNKTWVGANKEHNIYWFPPGGTVALLPNLTKAPFNNLDFRKGLSYALDRNTIANDAEEGYVKSAGQTGLLLPNQSSWLNTAIPNDGKVDQNTTLALKYFADAGYSSVNGKLVDSNGHQLQLTITTPNGYTDWLRGVQEVQSQLESVGISVSLNQPEPPAYTQALDNGDFELIMSAFGGTGSLYQDYNNLLNSQFATPVGTSTSANFQRYSNPETDALLQQFKVASTTSEQRQIVNELQKVVFNEIPVVSLFYGGLWGLFSTKNFTGWPSASDPYAPPSTWTDTALLVLTHLKRAS